MAGTLAIPNVIGAQPGGPINANLWDQNYTAIKTYVNERQVTFGPFASRPAAGIAGRYYYATDVGSFFADSGTGWLIVGAPGVIDSGLVPSATASVNRAALQAAIDALPASGGAIRIAAYGNHIDAEITVTKPLMVFGPGTTEVTTPGTFVLYLDTVDQNGFNVTAKGPFVLRDCSIRCADGSTAGAGILVNGPAGSLNGTESVLIENCVFYGGWLHIDFQAALFQRVTGCRFWNYGRAGVRVQNLLDGDQGDSLIDGNCTFNSAQAADIFGVLYLSGGGLKILGCKFLGNSAGVAVDPETTATDPATISDIIIANCSIEGFENHGILLTRTAGALAPQSVQILGCQISPTSGAGTVGISISPAAGAAAYDRVIMNDNIIAGMAIAFTLRRCTNLCIKNNQIQVSGAAFDVDSTVVNVVADNAYIMFGSFMTGTPGAGFLALGLGLQLDVADLPPVENGSQAWALDATGPQDGGGYTGYGMVAVGGGTGSPAWKSDGNWRV